MSAQFIKSESQETPLINPLAMEEPVKLNIRYPDMITPDSLAMRNDYNRICRLCAADTPQPIPLFKGKGAEYDIPGKIRKYMSIRVLASEPMPQTVCEPCASTLLSWHELVRSARLADYMLRRKLGASRALPIPSPPPSISGTETIKNGVKPTLQVDLRRSEPAPKENATGPDDQPAAEPIDPSDWRSSDRDGDSFSENDVPLSSIATKKSPELYDRLVAALVNFRNHIVSEHESPECIYPDATDSSDSEGELEADASGFDDLTPNNMRKDRMDERTRLELSEARTELGGRVLYACWACGKHLSSPHTYLFHRRIHTGERPCVCHVCGKQFRAPGGLQRHLTETHERLRRHSCDLCPKTFVNLQNLKQHLRIHTGERPHACAECGKRFAQSGSLHAHARTHSPRAPHECAECGARFKLRAGLARHRLRHSGERPHACAACPRRFRQRHDLAAHALAHSDARPYACAACPAAFRQRKALRHHCRRVHDAPAPAPAPVPAAPLAPPLAAPVPAEPPPPQLTYTHSLQPYYKILP